MSKIENLTHLMGAISEAEWIIVDVLRNIVLEALPQYCKEKISYNVPFFYGNKGICIIWPASIPRGGIREGVLLGFWQGFLLKDDEDYLSKGTNKKIFYKIYKKVEEIDVDAIIALLKEAVILDQSFRNK